MAYQHAFLAALLICTLGLFAWGRWRYDLVAFVALLVATAAGVVPVGEAFLGFGHQATVTVALVLIIGRALINAGAVALITRHLMPPVESRTGLIAVLTAVSASVSTLMNNVGALAMLMPAALETAAKASRSPALVLMPLSFASLLGGLVTLIGTPPNIIVSAFRSEATGEPFAMFDFTPVGGAVAVCGLAFIATVGWRLVPRERRAARSPRALFHIEDYVTEVRVGDGSRIAGQPLSHLETLAGEHDADVLGLLRRNQRIDRPDRDPEVRAGDVVVLRAGSEALDKVLSALRLEPLETAKRKRSGLLTGERATLMEATVPRNARIEGRTAVSLRLRQRFGVALIAVSRQGQPFRGRIRTFRFQAGDVLLLEGDPDGLPEALAALGCLPLAERFVTIGKARFALATLGIFAAALAAAAFGGVGIAVALGFAAVAMVGIGVLSPREVYEAIDWPVIVLLGSMIPIGRALETSGVTALIADALAGLATDVPPAVTLMAVLVVTMTLSDILNNAATAVVMAPLAFDLATRLGCNPDAFLMAVAIGASCAFLTPIGHQNNTLVLGPGGYRFGDYWRMGLPLEILIVAVATPMLLWVWPL